MQRKLSICALFYGDHSDLATRCLGSIERSLSGGARYVQDFRLACNVVSPETLAIVRAFADSTLAKYGIPSRLFFFDDVHKYPAMRRLFDAHEPLADATMWFDDDSYFEGVRDAAWWLSMWENLEQADMLGQFWLMPIQGNQWQWVKSQSWFNEQVGLPPKKVRGKLAFEFCQGAWWVIRSEILKRYDWPLAEIRHNGGDSMLGELFRHQGLRMARFYGGVRINADEKGRHSKAKRRGYNERRVGADYTGKPLDTSHQHIFHKTELINSAGSPQFSTEIIDLFGPDDDAD